MDQIGPADTTDQTDLQGPHEVYEPDAADQPLDTGASGDPDIDMRLELIVSTFETEAAARAAYDELREAEKEEILLLVDAAVVMRDQGNRLHISEEQDMGAPEGAIFGAAIGTILGFIAGPLGLVIGGAAGAAVGAAAAQASDSGLSDERLREFGDTLQPGSAMVIVVVAHYWSALTAAFLTRAGGEVKNLPLTEEIARQLDLDRPLG